MTLEVRAEAYADQLVGEVTQGLGVLNRTLSRCKTSGSIMLACLEKCPNMQDAPTYAENLATIRERAVGPGAAPTRALSLHDNLLGEINQRQAIVENIIAKGCTDGPLTLPYIVGEIDGQMDRGSMSLCSVLQNENNR